MKTSIILEGPNGSGKSTIGKILSDRLNMSYVHAGPSPGNHIQALKACIQQYQLLAGYVILDRCTPISRSVYERPLQDHELSRLKMFEDLMLERSVIVYCVGNGEFRDKSYYPKGHFEEVSRDRDNIRSRYESHMESTPHVIYNWHEDSADDLMERILHE